MKQVPRGFSIKIFLAEGHPSGLRLVEKSNWSGIGVVCPRPRYHALKPMDLMERAGVYLLLSAEGAAELPRVYIGQADPVGERLNYHYLKNDFWTVAYFFTSKDANLNKAHVQYLEHRLYELAFSAKRCVLENTNRPGEPSLSAADTSDAESFLDEMLLCFPVLGVTIFETPVTKSTDRRIVFHLQNKGVEADGYESEDGFVVMKGAKAIVDVAPSAPPHAVSLREALQQNGILVKEGQKYYRLTQDYEFSSPSTAAAFLVAASINGRDVWKTSNGQTLKEIQEGRAK